VYLERKTDELLEQIPPTFEGYKVEVEETGELRPLESSHP
jgi:hypothetical protein